MLRKSFVKDLDGLNNDMIEMTRLSEKAIDNTVLALEEKDFALAEQIAKNDDVINKLQTRIEKKCIQILVRQQPVAGDMRKIISVLKMATDVERIADHAVDICNLFIKVKDYTDLDLLWDVKSLRKMSNLVTTMLNDSINAFLSEDLALAKSIREQDEKVNDEFKKCILAYEKIMADNPNSVKQGIRFILIAKYLERIGDHSKNLAEWVIYSITGELVF